ncbi:MAG: ROK family glucokinase [Roseburia sp.]
MKKYAFGVDIGGTTCKIGFFETDGNLLEKWEIQTDIEENGKNILPNLIREVTRKLQERGIGGDEVEGVGIGVPGAITDGGIAQRCVNLGWEAVNVREAIEQGTGIRVKVGNDANVAALGEMWQGAAKGCRDVVMVTLGTGVGGGIIVDGRMVSGFCGAGGEIGHITVNLEETERCNCGRCGCLEQYASATGIVRMAKRRLAQSGEQTRLRAYPTLTAKDIFDAAKAQDEVAVQLVEDVCEILGVALSNISCVANPEIIVVGGGVSKAGDMLIHTLSKHYIEHAFPVCRNTKFVLAGLGNDAGMYGSVQMLFD